MTPAQQIANQINAHIEDLKANNEWFDAAELVYDYFAEWSEGHYQEMRLIEEVLDLVIIAE